MGAPRRRLTLFAISSIFWRLIRQNTSKYVKICQFSFFRGSEKTRRDNMSIFVFWVGCLRMGNIFRSCGICANKLAKPSDIQDLSDPNPSDTDAKLFVLLPILGSDIGCATRTRNDARAWTRFSAHCRTQVIIIAFRTLPIPFSIKTSHRKATVKDISSEILMHNSFGCLGSGHKSEDLGPLMLCTPLSFSE